MKIIEKFKSLASEELTGLGGERNYVIRKNGCTYILEDDCRQPFVFKMEGNELQDCLTLSQCMREIK